MRKRQEECLALLLLSPVPLLLAGFASDTAHGGVGHASLSAGAGSACSAGAGAFRKRARDWFYYSASRTRAVAAAAEDGRGLLWSRNEGPVRKIGKLRPRRACVRLPRCVALGQQLPGAGAWHDCDSGAVCPSHENECTLIQLSFARL